MKLKIPYIQIQTEGLRDKDAVVFVAAAAAAVAFAFGIYEYVVLDMPAELLNVPDLTLTHTHSQSTRASTHTLACSFIHSEP